MTKEKNSILLNHNISTGSLECGHSVD